MGRSRRTAPHGTSGHADIENGRDRVRSFDDHVRHDGLERRLRRHSRRCMFGGHIDGVSRTQCTLPDQCLFRVPSYLAEQHTRTIGVIPVSCYRAGPEGLMKRGIRVAVCAFGTCTVGAVLYGQSAARPTRAVTDPGVITTRQTITPAGVQTVFDGRVFGLTFGSSEDELWVLAGARGSGPNVYRMDWRENVVKDRWELQGTPALQGLALDPVRNTPLVGITAPPRAVGNRVGGAVRLLRTTARHSCRSPLILASFSLAHPR